MYLESNTRPDISFGVHQCDQFTHNTKVSHEKAVKRICRYLQGTKENGLVFNPSKNLVVDFYADAYFAGLLGHEDHQDHICARSITVFVATFANCHLFWVSKLQTEIALSTLHSEYVALSHSVGALLTLKSLIKELIENLGIDSERLKFVSNSTIYEDINRVILGLVTKTMDPLLYS